MYEKLSEGSSLLCEHELLEILLYPVLPRVNTNPIAHNLIRRFGSIFGVLNASPAELMQIDGIGARAAKHLQCVGEVLRRMEQLPKQASVSYAPDSFAAYLIDQYADLSYEVFDLYFLNQKSVIVGSRRFTSHEQSRVVLGTGDLSKALGECRAYGLVLAHNHIDSKAYPSEEDNNITRQCQIICSLNNIRLYDHFIIAGEESFSYCAAGMLQEINGKYNLKALMEK